MIMPRDLKLQDCLHAVSKNFAKAGIETPNLDARLLVQQATGFDHGELILRADHLLAKSEIVAIDQMVLRRLTHEPVSRIVGEREFYGRCFRVTKDVLDPRPDTETLVEQVLAVCAPGGQTDILDIGTGSGAIIITLLCELVDARGLASDVSSSALEIARFNAQSLGVTSRLAFIKTRWCAGIKGKFDMIVSNPPYIPASDIENLSRDVKNFDPRLALDGGQDGLQAYREIASQCSSLLKPGGLVVMEVGHDQAGAVVNIFKTAQFLEPSRGATIVKDLAGHNRVVTMLWEN